MAEPFATLSSQNHYHGDGSTTIWNFSFADGYIDQAFVRAYTRDADGVRTELGLLPEFFVGPFTLQIVPAVPVGTTLVIYRATERRRPLVDFKDGGRITEESLDTVARQSVHLAAEMSDYVGTGSEGDVVELAQAASIAAASAVASATASANSAAAASSSATAAAGSAASAASSAASAVGSAASAASAVASAIAALATITVFSNGITDNRPALVAAMATGKQIAHSGNAPWVISSPLTFTVPVQDTQDQLFREGDSVTLAAQPFFRPEWFGLGTNGALMRAVNATPAEGGLIVLMNRRYLPSYYGVTSDKVLSNTCVAGVDYLSKPGIRIHGAGIARYHSDGTTFINSTGSIIDGPFFVWADDFSATGFSTDSGSAAVARNWGGQVQDGFDFSRPNHIAEAGKNNVTLGKLNALCANKTTAGHAVLMEGIESGFVDYAEGRNSAHNVVIKSNNFRAGTLKGRGSSLESVILKSDDYGVLSDVSVDLVDADSLGGTDAGFGLLCDAVSANGGTIHVKAVKTRRKANGVGVRAQSTFAMERVKLDYVMSDGCPIAMLFSGGVLKNVTVDTLEALNSTYAVRVESTVTSRTNYIGRLVCTNATEVVNADGVIDIGSFTATNVSGQYLGYNSVNTRIRVGSYNTIAPFPSRFWGLQPAGFLAGSWVGTSEASAPVQFLMAQNSGKIRLCGTASGGGSGVLVNGFSVQLRPATPQDFVCSTAAGGIAIVRVGTDGVVTVVNWASGMVVRLNCEWDTPF